MKRTSIWVTLGMSLFLVLSTEAADTALGELITVTLEAIPDLRNQIQDRSPITPVSSPVNPSFTFIQTDPGVSISGSERRMQGNTQTRNNTQTPGELFGITLLRQNRVSQFWAGQTGTEPDTAGFTNDNNLLF
jgi:hypothetical protein